MVISKQTTNEQTNPNEPKHAATKQANKQTKTSKERHIHTCKQTNKASTNTQTKTKLKLAFALCHPHNQT
jgi:hypothetical protein